MSARAPPKPEGERETSDQDTVASKIYAGEAADTTDTNVRWAAYANRVRTIMRAGHRYVAYTSDIGESFRPLAHPKLVRTAYGISWLYLTGDVAHEGYKAYLSNQATLRGGHAISPTPEFLQPPSAKPTDSPKPKSTTLIATPACEDETYPYDANIKIHPKGHVPFLEDYRTVMVQRAIFQGVASMGLPAFTIHSVVRYSGRALKDVKNATIRTWGPVGLGLAVVPALPYMFDKPVEEAVEWVFHKGYQAYSGEGGVRHEKEKEL